MQKIDCCCLFQRHEWSLNSTGPTMNQQRHDSRNRSRALPSPTKTKIEPQREKEVHHARQWTGRCTFHFSFVLFFFAVFFNVTSDGSTKREASTSTTARRFFSYFWPHLLYLHMSRGRLFGPRTVQRPASSVLCSSFVRCSLIGKNGAAHQRQCSNLNFSAFPIFCSLSLSHSLNRSRMTRTLREWGKWPGHKATSERGNFDFFKSTLGHWGGSAHSTNDSP